LNVEHQLLIIAKAERRRHGTKKIVQHKGTPAPKKK